MSSYQGNVNNTPNGVAGTLSPSATLTSSNTTSTVMNNGPSSSPIVMATTGSPVLARQSQPVQSQPEQIIVPVGNVMNTGKIWESTSTTSRPTSAQPQASASAAQGASGSDTRGVLDRSRLRDLVKEVDPLEQMDDDVEDVLLQVADDFIENVVAASCQLAKHRRSNTLEAKDVQLYLERSWNMQIPGFGLEEIRPYKKSVTTEAHKQRLALIRKTMKKY